MVVEGPFLCHQQRVVDVLRKWFDQWHLSRRQNKARSSCIRIGPSAEQLEPRRMLSAGGLISRSAPLERTEAVYFSDGMGPDPVVFGKSEIIGQSQPSFVVTSVAHGVVQKWNDSKSSWIDMTSPPQSSDPTALLAFFQSRLCEQGDRLRWIPESPSGSSGYQEAFEILGWDDGIEPVPVDPTLVPTHVQELVLATTGVDELTVVWDPSESGAPTAYTVTRRDDTNTTVTVTNSTSVVFENLDLSINHTFSVTASNSSGTSESRDVAYTVPVDQTTTFSMVTPWDGPFTMALSEYDMGTASMPTLQSFASAVYGPNKEWVLLAGRTNGLHGFNGSGIDNFPPKYQNTDVWVVDPITQQTWSRSLDEAGLTEAEIDSLSATNTLSHQDGDTLFVVGGYVYDRGANDFTTYNALSAIHLPSLVNWVKTPGVALDANAILQVAGAEATDQSYEGGFFAVTGGSMQELDGRYFLVFGQNFEGPYTPGTNGAYTSQVRGFDISYDFASGALSYDNVSVSPSGGDPSQFRRRDLNVFPILSPSESGMVESVSVLAGVFYNGNAVWTVPVDVGADGVPVMVDPVTHPDVFKQAMNHYESAKIGLYDPGLGVMTEILLGGISANTFDTRVDGLVYDSSYGFTNQITAVVRNADGNLNQQYLGEFPVVRDGNDKRLYFGANAQFFAATGVGLLPGEIIDVSALTNETVIGYVFGGIAADQPNRGHTVASPMIFEVRLTPTI